MEVGLEISTSGILGNEVPENRSGRLLLFKSRRYSQYHWRQWVKRVEAF